MSASVQRGVVLRLGIAQTLAWASSYYLPALIAKPLASELGFPVTHVFGAFTLALVVSALVGPLAGRAIDQRGGRIVLIATNILFALGLTALALAVEQWHVWLAWCFIGVAMGSGLYDAAFATLVRLYPQQARSAITGITLIAGFASTVGWPLTAWWIELGGWRSACFAWALLHILLGLPLHLLLPSRQFDANHASQAFEISPVSTTRSQITPQYVSRNSTRFAIAMAVVFAITWFTSTAMAAHLPVLLEKQGLGPAAALGIAMLVGPSQVAGRLLEFSFLRRIHPLLSARLAATAHPLGVASLFVLGPTTSWVFTGLHGAGNGILTIAKGTLPLVVFGAGGYGERQGWLMAPARLAQAIAPLLFGIAMTSWGSHALWLTAGLSLISFILLHWMSFSLAHHPSVL